MQTTTTTTTTETLTAPEITDCDRCGALGQLGGCRACGAEPPEVELDEEEGEDECACCGGPLETAHSEVREWAKDNALLTGEAGRGSCCPVCVEKLDEVALVVTETEPGHDVE